MKLRMKEDEAALCAGTHGCIFPLWDFPLLNNGDGSGQIKVK